MALDWRGSSLRAASLEVGVLLCEQISRRQLKGAALGILDEAEKESFQGSKVVTLAAQALEVLD